jgi:hypothetical protein
MNRDPILVKLVKKQTDLFNQDAPEIEKMLALRQIQDYQKEHPQ